MSHAPRAFEAVVGRASRPPATPTNARQQDAVVVFAELSAQQVKGERVQAAVGVGQAEAYDLGDVPEHVE